MSLENLWGELPQSEMVETPVSILRTQAIALGKLTSGLLEGRVVSGRASEGKLSYEFRIVAPGLGNYTTTILYLEHGVQMYPALIRWIDEPWEKA